MEIIRIFAGEDNPILFSSLYDKGDDDEFKKIFNDWQNPEYLELFFEKNKEDLKYFGNDITIEDAINETIIDAKNLEAKIKRLAENSLNGNKVDLDSMFLPLNDNEFELIPSKAYGKNLRRNNKSWLRIYAIKLDDNVYVVSGGMIKLTQKIQDREHGKAEIRKLTRTKDYLKSQGVLDAEGLN